jgi:hypothetical protein
VVWELAGGSNLEKKQFYYVYLALPLPRRAQCHKMEPERHHLFFSLDHSCIVFRFVALFGHFFSYKSTSRRFQPVTAAKESKASHLTQPSP